MESTDESLLQISARRTFCMMCHQWGPTFRWYWFHKPADDLSSANASLAKCACQEWIERMDDEEGEEDEEGTCYMKQCIQRTMPINEHFRVCEQDELFHTGEECIDRVAEAENPAFP